MTHTGASIAIITLALLAVTACAPHMKYRSVHPAVCVSPEPKPTPECETHALQQLPSDNGSSYLLGFIEFDDQGQLWDRTQMRDVLSKLQTEAGTRDLLMVVFVHGWKHSAAPGDTNINTFRGVLANLSDTEAYLAKNTGTPARQVVGIYFGWRGGSLPVKYLENVTFWDRKNTAQKVGHGGVTEVLSQLEDIKLSRDSMVCRDRPMLKNATTLCGSNTRLVVVGHSFGGAVMQTALAQILENRFVQTTDPAGLKSNIKGFGSLMVLINPAFEANLFTPMSDMAAERTYFPSQLPVVLVLTSEADAATRYAFPIGRWFSTIFEKVHDRQRRNATTGQTETISERDANISAIGHFEPYRTHNLYPATERTREELKAASVADSIQTFMRSSDDWAHDRPGSKITFGDVVLERTTSSAGRNPYLVTYVDGRLIHDHNDIDDPRVIEFVKQLILISSHSEKQTAVIQEKLKIKP
jgi:hypothetical protein